MSAAAPRDTATMIETEGAARAWLAELPEWDALAAERLDRLAALLAEENQRQNLVSAASMAEVWCRHIADSAQLLTHVPRGTSPWLDLGTGAGFPGLVIAALRPEAEVVMVESRMRRAEWLDSAISALGLKCTRVMADRLERVPTFATAVISARAFAPLDRLLELSARFSTAATFWLLPKGRSAREELDALDGWRHVFHVEPSLTDLEAGIIMGQLEGRAPGGKREKRREKRA
jgi:16S rRNA (guanine527-N7)-methyltransferase